MEQYRELLEIASFIMELFAVAIIIGAFLKATFSYPSNRRADGREVAFQRYRSNLGQGLLLGLEILVVADVIDSIVVEPTFTSLGVLAFLIVIRTLISWSATLQTEGRWPWQADMVAQENGTQKP